MSDELTVETGVHLFSRMQKLRPYVYRKQWQFWEETTPQRSRSVYIDAVFSEVFSRSELNLKETEQLVLTGHTHRSDLSHRAVSYRDSYTKFRTKEELQ